MFRFLHLADTHLGCDQYGLEARARDMAAAFRAAASFAMSRRVDFVVFAGDVFHSRNVGPQTLLQAVTVLAELRQASIPVITIAGNHDRGWRAGGYSWLSVLHDLGYLRHLDVAIDRGTLSLNSPDSATPSYVEVGEARVFGLPYLGASLPKLIEQFGRLASALPPRYNIMLTHSGLDGELPGLTQPLRHDQLAPLRSCINYVALGHLHKPFEREGWIYNPGSPEALGTDQWQYPGGWYLVEADRGTDGQWTHQAEHHAHRRRSARRLPSIDVGYYQTPAALAEAVDRIATDAADLAGKRALVELTLRGRLRFSAAEVDMAGLTAIVEKRLQPLKVLARNLAEPAGTASIEDGDAPRHEIEMRVLRQHIASDGRYESIQEAMARLALEVKAMALTGVGDEEVFDHVVSRHAALEQTMGGGSAD